MDIEVLKKKISTFRGEGGRVRITDDQLYMETLFAWEQWKGSSKEFYSAIGVSKSGMAAIIGKAKRMRREGYFPAEEFKEVKLNEGSFSGNDLDHRIELVWERGKVIRFRQVVDVLDFLRGVGDNCTSETCPLRMR